MKKIFNFQFSILNFKHKGFTLIELIVVLSVTSVLGTIGLAGFTKYNQVQVLQSATSEVSTMLTLARSRAQSQIKLGTSCSASSQALDGYNVDISIDNSSKIYTYTLSSRCSGIPSILNTKTLPKDISFVSPPGFNSALYSFFFPIHTGGVQANPATDQIILQGYSRQQIITVNSLGGVSILARDLVPTPTPTPTATPTQAPTATPTPTSAPSVTCKQPITVISSNTSTNIPINHSESLRDSCSINVTNNYTTFPFSNINIVQGSTITSAVFQSPTVANGNGCEAGSMHDVNNPGNSVNFGANTIVVGDTVKGSPYCSGPTYYYNPSCVTSQTSSHGLADVTSIIQPLVSSGKDLNSLTLELDPQWKVSAAGDFSFFGCYGRNIYYCTWSVLGANFTVNSTGVSSCVGSGSYCGSSTYPQKTCCTGLSCTDHYENNGDFNYSDCEGSAAPTPTPPPSVGTLTIRYCPPLTTPTPTLTPTPILNPSRVFVTSQNFTGGYPYLSGLSSADNYCTNLARNVGNYNYYWKAWLSDSQNAAKDRLYHSPNPYVLMDGKTIVANNWSDLTSGNLRSPINVDEHNNGKSSYYPWVWTNTTTNGGIAYTDPRFNCQNWTNGSSSYSGSVGDINPGDASWTGWSYTNCAQALSLYCFEQINSPYVPPPCYGCSCDNSCGDYGF